METPKPTGGRPRRRPFAAHDARAVATRARNARYWLQQLRWCIDGHPEVREYFRVTRRDASEYYWQHQSAMQGVLDMLLQELTNPVAPDEGRADD